MKNFNEKIDYVIILNCISSDDNQLFQNLAFDDLIASFDDMGLRHALAEHLTPTPKLLLNELEIIKKKAEQGMRFLIHIFSHGDEKGIEFIQTKEKLSWQEMAKHFADINKASSNTLILYMTTCKGLNAIKINTYYPNSCLCLIGSPRDLRPDEVIEVNKQFYILLKDNEEIKEIVGTIQKSMEIKGVKDVIELIYS